MATQSKGMRLAFATLRDTQSGVAVYSHPSASMGLNFRERLSLPSSTASLARRAHVRKWVQREDGMVKWSCFVSLYTGQSCSANTIP